MERHVKKMAAAAGRGVFIVSAKRTPFGAFGGKLKNLSATELSAVAASAALESGGVRPELVDSVVIGNVAQVLDCVCIDCRGQDSPLESVVDRSTLVQGRMGVSLRS